MINAYEFTVSYFEETEDSSLIHRPYRKFLILAPNLIVAHGEMERVAERQKFQRVKIHGFPKELEKSESTVWNPEGKQER